MANKPKWHRGGRRFKSTNPTEWEGREVSTAAFLALIGWECSRAGPKHQFPPLILSLGLGSRSSVGGRVLDPPARHGRWRRFSGTELVPPVWSSRETHGSE